MSATGIVAIVLGSLITFVLYTSIGIVVGRAIRGHVVHKALLAGRQQWTVNDAAARFAFFGGLLWPLLPLTLLPMATWKIFRRVWVWADDRVAVGAEKEYRALHDPKGR